MYMFLAWWESSLDHELVGVLYSPKLTVRTCQAFPEGNSSSNPSVSGALAASFREGTSSGSRQKMVFLLDDDKPLPSLKLTVRPWK